MENKYQLGTLPYGLNKAAGLDTSDALASMRQTATDMAPAPYTLPTGAGGRRAAAAYSPSLKQFFISGPQGSFTFEDGNDTAALESLKVFDPSQPAELPPGDWQPLSDAGFAAYVESIRNPGMKKLAKKNFGIGVDNLQALVGSGLKFAGAEETGQSIMDQQEKDLSKTMPYQRLASDIGSDPDRGILDWFVANIAQQGPNIVESAVTAVLGGIAGGAAGGGPNPITAAGGAFAALVGKSAFKSGLLAAAKKHAAGEILEAGEKKLLLEAAGIVGAAEDVMLKAGAGSAFKQAGRIGGAGLTTLTSNQAMGVADIYSEEGATRGYAAAGSIPYALLESSTEFLLAGRLFGDLVSGGKPLRDLGYTKKAMELLRRTTVGGTVGGVLEGSVEAGQEGLLMAANPAVDWDSPDSVTRLFNSFAAGAGVGGPIGSIANLRGRTDPANLLNPTQSAEPGAPLAAPTAPVAGLAPKAPEGTAVPLTSMSPAGAIGTQEPASILGNRLPPVVPPMMAAPTTELTAQVSAPATPPVINATTQLGESTLGQGAAMLRKRMPILPTSVDVTPGAIPAPIAPASPATTMSTGGNFAVAPQAPIPAFEPAPLPTSGVAPVAAAMEPAPVAAAPELNADFYPDDLSTPAEVQLPAPIDLSQYVPASQAPVGIPTGGAALQKGTKPKIRVSKAVEPATTIMTRDYGAVADGLGDTMNALDYMHPDYAVATGRVQLAERLANMGSHTLQKLQPVWDPKFEPDVTNKPDEVMALIDRTLGVKPKAPPKAQSLMKGSTARHEKTIVTQEVTERDANIAARGQKEIAAAVGAPAKAMAAERDASRKAGAAVYKAEKAAKGEAFKKAVATKEAKPSIAPAVAEKPANKVTPTEAARAVPGAKGLLLKKASPLPPPESAVKNAEGVAAPVIKTAEPESKSEDLAELNRTIATWNDSSEIEDLTSAVRFIFDVALFGDSNDTTYGRKKEALATLDSMLLDAMRAGTTGDDAVAFDRALVEESKARTTAAKQQAEEDGKPAKQSAGQKELAKLVAQRGLIARVKAATTTREFKVGWEQVSESKPLAAATDMDSLTSVIDTMLTDRRGMQDTATRTRLANDAKLAYNTLRKAGEDPVIHGVKASKLFKNGRLDINYDAETKTYRLAVGMDVARDVMTAMDAPTGMFSRVSDGKPLTKKFAPSETRLKMLAILDRFKFRPKAVVFRNVADLKMKNPKLYARAAAARASGDFDATNAAGYSFADYVLIFSDYIRDDRHLSLVLSHETLGHFGLRAFLPQAQLKQQLDSVYNADTRLAQKVDQIVADTGMDKHEVIEEYLADYAAVLDNSMLRNIWNILKNALNKLGISFEDDYARLLINQSRRYVRHGGTGGSAFSATELYDRMERMRTEHSEGRYSTDPLDGEHLSSKAIAAQAISADIGVFGWRAHLKKNGPVETFGALGDLVKDIIGKIVGAVETLDFRASRSVGLGAVYKLFEAQHNLSRQQLTQLQQITSFTHKANWGFANKDAPVEADKQEAGELLAYAAIMKLGKVDTKLMDSYGSIITVDEYGNIDEDPEVIKAIMKDGFVTADEFRKGLTWKNSLDKDVTYPAREIDESSKYWKIYLEQREAVNQAALNVLRANHNALSNQNLSSFDGPSKMKAINGNRFTADDLTTLREISQKFYKLYLTDMTKKDAHVQLKQDSVDKAQRFMYAVTRVMDKKEGARKLDDWLNGKDDTSEFQDPEYKKLIDGLASLSKMNLRDKDSNRLKQTLQNVVMSQVDALNAEYYAKRTILGSYAPLKRDGRFQIRMVAVGEDGKHVELAPEYQGVMPYYREDSEKAAIEIRRNLDALFGKNEYKVKDIDGNEVTVTFVAEHSTAKQTPDLGDVMDYATFTYILERNNISITPAERQRLAAGLTAQGSMARSNLERTGNPGWRANMIRNLSEYLETSAHVAAKRTFRNQMDAVIDNELMWKGDNEKLETLKQAYKAPGLTPTQRDYLKRDYDTYASKYAYMANASEGAAVDIELSNGKTKSLPLIGRGEEAREEAKKLLRWQAQVLDITDSTEDILSTNIGAKLKTMTVLAQLGMSVATAFVNVGSLVTHSTTYMGFYNPKNGFGMGFGMVKATTAITRALGELKNNNFTDPKFIADLLEDKKAKKWEAYGLEEHEAEFLLEQTTNGTLQPAMFNALIGSARGKLHGNRINDAIQKWMYMFSYTESLNRRVTGLAAYRLELARIKASTSVSEKEAHKQASEAAHKAIITSQGEYSMFNRPELARGNFGQYIFMYKMFTAITVQMMRSLPPSGRVSFLAMMIVASGIKGVPFAEDIMDLIDTLAQMFGIKMTSIEKEAYQLFDGIAPGYAPYFMRGALDQLTGSTVSSKVGMGDIIPLSGSLKYGADPWNETKQFVGPVFGATMGLANMAMMTGKYGAEALGIKSDATTFNDILRNSPLAVMRSIGDSMAYMETGAITNIRGQVVSRDAGVSTYIARLLGFYPAESTRQNDIIRVSKMGGEYAKAIKSELVNAYVQAGIRGDKALMKHISQQVQEWNVNARGTGLEVKEFQTAVKKSLAEANRESVSRYLRSVSKQMKPQVEELMRLQGVDPTD